MDPVRAQQWVNIRTTKFTPDATQNILTSTSLVKIVSPIGGWYRMSNPGPLHPAPILQIVGSSSLSTEVTIGVHPCKIWLDKSLWKTFYILQVSIFLLMDIVINAVHVLGVPVSSSEILSNHCHWELCFCDSSCLHLFFLLQDESNSRLWTHWLF